MRLNIYMKDGTELQDVVLMDENGVLPFKEGIGLIIEPENDKIMFNGSCLQGLLVIKQIKRYEVVGG